MSYSIFNNNNSLNNNGSLNNSCIFNNEDWLNLLNLSENQNQTGDSIKKADDQKNNIFSPEPTRKRLRDFDECDSPDNKRLRCDNSIKTAQNLFSTDSECSSDSSQFDGSVFDEFLNYDTSFLDQLDQFDSLSATDSAEENEKMCVVVPQEPPIQEENIQEHSNRMIVKLEEQPKRDIRELQRWRAVSPVTKKAIELQAQLIQALREGKEWASSQPLMYPLGTSANSVFKLNSLTSGTNTAFFKKGQTDQRSVSIMEKLMWDVALILGLEELFVPTGIATIKTITQEMKGSIQPAQSGDVLENFLNITPPIHLEKKDLLKATLASFIFGMYDAHANNIFINDAKKILFFDNSRSLPHSNGFIKRQGWLIPAYRSCLLDLPQSKEPLTNLDLEIATGMVDSWNNRLNALEEYLNSESVNRLIQKLPQSWFDVDLILDSMEERIHKLKSVLQTNPPRNLQELIAYANPDYRLTYALTFAYWHLKGEPNDFIHNDVGFLSVDEITQSIVEAGYSVRTLKRIAENCNISWDRMCVEIQVELNKRPNKTTQGLAIFNKERSDLITALSNRAEVDDKDTH